MSKQRLVFLLVPVVLLAVVYAVFTCKWLVDQDAEEEVASAQSEATAAFMEEMYAQPDEVEAAEDQSATMAKVSPEVRLAEYPGRRLLVSGRVSTSDERRGIIDAVASDVGDSFQIDDQANLDYQCTEFRWLAAVERIDFSVIERIRRFKLELTNGSATLTGFVVSDAEAASVERHFQEVLPRGVTLKNELETVDLPQASLSVWAAPDSTILLEGILPEGAASAYVALVKEALPEMRSVSDLIEDRFVEKPAWEEQIKEFLPGFLRRVQRTSFTIEKGNLISIEGLAQADEMAALQSRIASTFTSPRYRVQMDLQVGVPTARTLTPAEQSPATASEVAGTVPEMLATMKIYFGSARSRVSQLDYKEKQKLDQLGRQWQRENFRDKVYVFGFTDHSGDPDTNAYFSEARCRSVVAYLKKEYGIDNSYFEVIGTPEDHPPETGTASELRRVEFSLTEDLSQPPITKWEAVSSSSPRQVLKPVSIQELLSETNEIKFKRGVARLAEEDRKALAQLGNIMALEKITDVIVLYGYSDTKGSARANRWYTEERCKAVAKALTEAGFPEDQVVLRPVLPARTTEEEADDEVPEDKVDETSSEEEEGEDASKSPDNPRRVQLVLMSREAFEQSEGAADAGEEEPDANVEDTSGARPEELPEDSDGDNEEGSGPVPAS